MSETITISVDGDTIDIEVGDALIMGSGSRSSVTSNTTITAAQNGITVDNTGASDTVIVTLPDSDDLTAGWTIRARVTVAEILRLKVQGTDTIRFDSIEGVAAGCLQAAELGACIAIEYQGDGKFYVTTPPMGIWSDNT